MHLTKYCPKHISSENVLNLFGMLKGLILLTNK